MPISQPFRDYEDLSLAQAMNMAAQLDASDDLAAFRERFNFPEHRGERVRYFCGNSLGLQPKQAVLDVEQELSRWQKLAVAGHFTGETAWMHSHDLMREDVAQLVGAKPNEVTVMNTLSVNLHLLMVSFFRPQGPKRKILIEKHAFPSDRYAVRSQLAFHGLDPDADLIEIGDAASGTLIDEGHVAGLIEKHAEELALVLLPGVQYYTGQWLDTGPIAQACAQHDITLGLDLAHAVGNVPVKLHEHGVDFACWCHYKYCNSGPGAIAGAFVHEKHHHSTLPRFEGWWGNHAETRFDMADDFHAAPGADAWQLSNPPVLSLIGIRSAVAMMTEAGLPRLRDKSVRMTGFLEHLLKRFLGRHVRILTPGIPARRGCQLSMELHDTAQSPKAIFDALIERGFVGDWREPNVIRVAPVPLYNSYTDCAELVAALHEEIHQQAKDPECT